MQPSFFYDNPYLCGTGKSANLRLGASKLLPHSYYKVAVRKLYSVRLEGRSFSINAQKAAQVCQTIKAVQVWEESSVLRSRALFQESPAAARVLGYILVPSGLREVEACVPANTRFHGKSES